MCKIISGESIIGNFLLAAVEIGVSQVKIEKLFEFETRLSTNLDRLNFFTCLSYMNILDFADDYPFFIKSVNENSVHLTDSFGQDVLSSKLNRYFKIGLPKTVISEMQTVSKSVLEDGF